MLKSKVILDTSIPDSNLTLVVHVTEELERQIVDFRHALQNANLPEATTLPIATVAYTTPLDAYGGDLPENVTRAMREDNFVTLPGDMDLQEHLQTPLNVTVFVDLHSTSLQHRDRFGVSFKSSSPTLTFVGETSR